VKTSLLPPSAGERVVVEDKASESGSRRRGNALVVLEVLRSNEEGVDSSLFNAESIRVIDRVGRPAPAQQDPRRRV